MPSHRAPALGIVFATSNKEGTKMVAWIACRAFGSGEEIWVNFNRAISLTRDMDDTRTFIEFGGVGPTVTVIDPPREIVEKVKALLDRP
jgi:hypothetical protein